MCERLTAGDRKGNHSLKTDSTVDHRARAPLQLKTNPKIN
jgi:hypothetical protein